MAIRCPICQHPLDLGRREAVADTTATQQAALGEVRSVRCPNCGLVPLPADLEETVIYPPSAGGLEGTRLAHFSFVRLLGQGACGEVWLADDVDLERRVALKLPISTRTEAAHLVREAQTAATLRHPNIVAVYEVGTESGQLFIASEYIEGITLRDFLTAGTPAVAKTVELVAAVARALHHAHQQGIVHRDVKPANILISTDGQPFVTDFGIAKRTTGHDTITSEGQVLGTARYMSPEQAGGKTRETDRRADIYSIGVVLFEMLTGHAPFRGNRMALLRQKLFEDPPSPRTLGPSLPKDLETICLKCLEREPGKRYQTAAEVAEELERFREGSPIHARPISSAERVWRWCRRRPAVAGLLASLILSLSTGLAGVTFYYWQAARSAEQTRRAWYRSQMNLAAEYLGRGDVAGLKQTLIRFSPDDRLPDLRGFEWHYYDALTAPYRHVVNQGDVVSDVAISADGRLFASSGTDRELRVWDAGSGQPIRALGVDTGRFHSIAFSAASGHLASGSSDGMVRIWDPRMDAGPIWSAKHGPPVAMVRFSPDGKLLLSCGTSGAVRVWDGAAESPVAEIPAGKTGAKDVRFSPDGKRIAVAGQDGQVRLWDLGSRKIVGELAPNPLVECLAFSDDGQTIATGNFAGTIRIWNLAEETLRLTRETRWGRIGDLEFVAGTPLLAIVASDGQLHLYDTQEDQEVRSFRTHNLTDGVLGRSANGEFLAVGSGDGSIKLIGAEGLAGRDILWHKAHVRSLDFLPCGKRLVAASGDGALEIWDLRSGHSEHLASAGKEITTVAAQRRGSLVATAGVAPRVALWDIDSRQVAHEIALPQSGVVAVAFSNGGAELAIATRLGGSFLCAADGWTRLQHRIAARQAAALALAFSADDRTVAIGYEDGEVQFIDSATGAPRVGSLHIPAVPMALAFCESDGKLAIGTDVGEIYLYDLVAQRVRSVIKGHTGRINALAVFPGGTTIVSGGRDRELRLWDTASGELLTTLQGHRRQVFAIAVSPDGRTVASGGLEGDIRIWRTRAVE